MGWFSRAVAWVTSTVTTVAEKILPSTINDMITTVRDWIFNTNKIEDAPRYDKNNATVDESVKMHELLDSVKNDYESQTKKLESILVSLVQDIFSSTIDLTSEFNKTFNTGLNVDAIKLRSDDAIQDLNGVLSKAVSDKLNLSNRELTDILKLDGSTRKRAVQSYIKKIIKEATNDALNKTEKTTNKVLSHDVRFHLERALDDKINHIQRLQEQANSINTIDVEKQIVHSQNKIESAQLIVKSMHI